MSTPHPHPKNRFSASPRPENRVYLTPRVAHSTNDIATPPSLPLLPRQLDETGALSSISERIKMRTGKNPFAGSSNFPSPNQAFYPKYCCQPDSQISTAPAPSLPSLSETSDRGVMPLRPRFRPTNLWAWATTCLMFHMTNNAEYVKFVTSNFTMYTFVFLAHSTRCSCTR